MTAPAVTRPRHASRMRYALDEVTAVIVTRGDIDLAPVLEALPFPDIVVWNNQERTYDAGVYGRYLALTEARNPVVYVQDDDCLIHDAAELVDLYERGMIVSNMPRSRWADYPDSCLVGWGAIFDAHLAPFAFARYATRHSLTDAAFLRDCDVVFTTLVPHRKVDLGFEHLPWAEDPARAMFLEPGHAAARRLILEQARAVRDDHGPLTLA